MLKNKKKIQLISIIGLFLVALGLLFLYKNIQVQRERDGKFSVSFLDEKGKVLHKSWIEKGKKAENYQPKERKDYIFVGWYLDEKLYDFDTPIEKNIKLTGKWEELLIKEKTHTVFFYIDDMLVEQQKVIENTKAYEPDVPVKEGYNFVGWYLEEVRYNFDIAVTKDYVLKAKFEPISNTGDEPGESETPIVTPTPPSVEEPFPTFPTNPGATASPVPTPPSVSPPEFIKETGIDVNFDKIVMGLDDTVRVIATVKPTNATIKDIQIYCENSLVCIVDKDGNITPFSTGKTNIILKTFSGITKKIPVQIKSSYQTQIRNNKLFIMSSEEIKVEGNVTLKYLETGETKTVHITKEGFPISGKIEVLSINVKD